MKPTSQTASLVGDWLKKNGITPKQTSAAGDWMQLSLSVSKANELLNTEFGVYTRTESGKQTIRTMAYSIPAHLKGHIDMIYPTIQYVVLCGFPEEC